MNITYNNFIKNPYNARYLSNNIRNNNRFSNAQYLNSNLSKVNLENCKANYMMTFKGGADFEKCTSNEIGTLNHQTAFFREPKTDKIVQNYILENFGDKDEIKIVSGACSTGEEAKSYAMMLDCLGDKLKIIGFDISPEVLKKANSNSCKLLKQDKDDFISCHISLGAENMLFTDDINSLGQYEQKCRNKFEQYYKPKGKPYKVPAFPEAKQELKDLIALLRDKEKVEKEKENYNIQIQKLQEEMPDLSEYMAQITFEDAMEMGKRTLIKKLSTYKTVADYETKGEVFDNCTFTLGDVTKLEDIFKADSTNVLLYRNALYHTLCAGNEMARFMKDDAKETMNSIARQMNKILTNKGLVVFGENEHVQGINKAFIKEVMENNGFKQFQKNGEKFDNIWIKCKDV